MDFMDSGSRGSQPLSQNTSQPTPVSTGKPRRPKKVMDKLKEFRILSVVLLFSGTVLVVALILSFLFSGTGERRLVDKNNLQAVFLNGGQVYFGQISQLTNQHIQLNDIFYLRVNQQVQPDTQKSQNDVSLVKLGCELHGPQDSMIINREQVMFWENLTPEGQVATAIKKFKTDNPDGQSCEQASSQTNTPSRTSDSTQQAR